MAQPIPVKPTRGGSTVGMVLLGMAFAVAFVPLIGPAIAHLVDRVRNGFKTNRELKARAEWYRVQVARQLGMNPDRVTKADLIQAAKINPHLRSVVNDVYSKEGDENRLSLFATVGASAASVIPGGGAVARTAIGIGGAVAGSGLAALMNKEVVSTQEIAEAIQDTLLQAHQQGLDPRQVISTQSLFLLRVSQNDKLGAEIKQQFGKALHKMTAAEQTVVMNQYQALAQAATSEAYAVATGMLPVQELVASAPNLSGMASRVVPQTRSGSFTEREQDRRAMAAQAANLPAV